MSDPLYPKMKAAAAGLQLYDELRQKFANNKKAQRHMRFQWIVLFSFTGIFLVLGLYQLYLGEPHPYETKQVSSLEIKETSQQNKLHIVGLNLRTQEKESYLLIGQNRKADIEALLNNHSGVFELTIAPLKTRKTRKTDAVFGIKYDGQWFVDPQPTLRALKLEQHAGLGLLLSSLSVVFFFILILSNYAEKKYVALYTKLYNGEVWRPIALIVHFFEFAILVSASVFIPAITLTVLSRLYLY